MDNYGFSALPGGYGVNGGNFYNAGYYGTWWSATERDDSYGYLQHAYHRYMDYNYEYVASDYYLKTSPYSVRCIKD